MSQNNIPTNDDANNTDSSPGVLDTTGAGGPHIPRSATGGPSDPPDSTGGSGGEQPQPPTEELVIEVEIAPEVEDIDALLTGINLPASPITPSHETDFVRVARTHGVITAQSVFTREEVQEHRARVDALRDSSLITPSAGGSSEQFDRLEKLMPLSNYVQLRFPPGTSADTVIAQLNALPQVKRVAVVPELAPPSFPTDVMIGTSGSIIEVDPQTHIEKQWYLHRTRVPQAWQHADGANVVIADLDFGVRTSHREFVGAIERTRNTFDKTNDVTAGESFGHGTAVLGIAGARSNAEGVAGYAPKAKLWAIQGNTGNSPQQSTTPWSDGIKFVLNTAAPGRRKVLLIEVETRNGGNVEQIDSIHQLIRQAIAENCVVVVAAGNGNRHVNLADNGRLFDGTGSILVGATIFHETQNKRAPFSNFGPNVVVSAPGDEIHDVTCGQTADNAYRNGFGGTSGAAAKVAGTVALMLSVNDDLSHEEVRDIIRTTGSPIITDVDITTGLQKTVGRFLNAEAAVLEALNRLNN
jgi:subtilisin family serine protease